MKAQVLIWKRFFLFGYWGVIWGRLWLGGASRVREASRYLHGRDMGWWPVHQHKVHESCGRMPRLCRLLPERCWCTASASPPVCDGPLPVGMRSGMFVSGMFGFGLEPEAGRLMHERA